MSKRAKAAPGSFLSKLKQDAAGEALGAVKDHSAWAEGQLDPADAAPPASTFGRVTREYHAKAEGELTLRGGDIVIILDRTAEGWWRGQLGHEEGWFPEGHTESVSEEEVAAFIAESSGKSKKSKQEWQAEMSKLKEDLKTAQTSSAKLKEEVEKLREDYKKKSKSVRGDILEVMEQLPSAFYHIDPIANFHRDTRRTTVELGEVLDSAPAWTESLVTLIEQLNVFVPAFGQQCQVEAKLLKPSQDKIDPASRNLIAALTTQHSNSVQDQETAKLAFEIMNLFAADLEKVAKGEVKVEDLKPAEPPTSPRDKTTSPPTSPHGDGEDAPKERKKKRYRGDASGEADGKPDRRRHRDKDKVKDKAAAEQPKEGKDKEKTEAAAEEPKTDSEPKPEKKRRHKDKNKDKETNEAKDED